MFTFFANAKKIYQAYRDALSFELLEIISPDVGNANPKAAQEFIAAHTDQSLNFYLKKNVRKVNRSILWFCVVSAGWNEFQIDVLLEHPSMHNQKTHDWEAVYQCIEYALSYPRLLMRLMEFYKPRIPLISQEKLRIHHMLSDGSTDGCIKGFNGYFSNFPPQEIWRLFVEAELQRKENGWLDYETREPGAIKGMLNGFLHMKQHITLPLTVELLLALHAACSTNVENLHSSTPGKCRHERSVQFALLYNENATLEGLFELLEKQMKEHLTLNYRVEHLSGKRCGIVARAETSRALLSRIKKTLAQYEVSLALCATNEEKINVIIDLITSLERTHPFGDANCRTICVLLLNRELIRSGLSPVILDDPNRFDGFSKNELFNDVSKGMATFYDVQHGNLEDLGIATSEILIKINEEVKYAACANTHTFLQNQADDALAPLRVTSRYAVGRR